MNLLQKIFLIIFQTSLNASVLILFTMLILKIFNKKLTYRIKYGLCFFVMLRFIIPVIPNSNIINITSIINDISISNTSSSDNDVDLNDSQINNTSEDAINSLESVQENTNITLNNSNNQNSSNIISQDDSNIDINNENYSDTTSLKDKESLDKEKINNIILINTIKYASIIWGLGIILFTTIFIFSTFRFSKNTKDSYCLKNSRINLIADELRKKLNIKKNIAIYIYDDIKSPCILGFFRPRIYVPGYLVSYEIEHDDSNTIEYILLHELFHYKRKDTYQNLISLIAVIIHWFNPMAWKMMLKVKNYREYACDSGVLDFLDEDENINYGMTLINFSKISLNRKGYSSLAICFDFNKQIKGRVKMIKDFKKGSYKISKIALVGCVISAIVILLNGFSVQALDANNFEVSSEESSSTSDETNNTEDYINYINDKNRRFLVDSTIKSYGSLSVLQEKLGFEFDVPNYILSYNEPRSYKLIKVSDENYVANISFESEISNSNQNFIVRAFKGDSIETMKAVEAIQASENDRSTIATTSQARSIVGINGQDITITINTPEQIIDGVRFEQSQVLSKSFVWKKDDIYYSVNYYKAVSSPNSYQETTNIWEDDLRRIVSSFSKVEEIYSVDYSKNSSLNIISKDYTTMSIYDKEDLEKATTLIGFTPNLLLDINEEVKIINSAVGVTNDSDIENNDIHYEVNNFYTNVNANTNSTITVNMSNHDTYGDFKNIKNNSYIITNRETNQKVNVEKVELNNKEVYKYVDNNGSSRVYTYEDKGIYYKIILFQAQEYNDELAGKFIELT